MRFYVSGNLMRFTGHLKEIDVEAATIGAAFGGLVERYPDLRGVLFDANGKLRGVHRLFLNGAQLAGSESAQALRQDDELSLVTAIAGG